MEEVKRGSEALQGNSLWALLLSHPSGVFHGSTRVQSPSAFCLSFSRPPNPGLCRIGRGGFSAIRPGDEQHSGDSVSLLGRDQSVDGGEVPNRR